MASDHPAMPDTGAGALPATVEVSVYRQLWPDLAHLDDQTLQNHFESFGAEEGRRANSIVTREEFAALVPADADALEIGPFCKPLLQGARTRYFDVMDKAALEARARALGMENPAAPHIDFVSPFGDLVVVDDTFDCALSSHCIEHQPDLVAHLQQVARVLRPGGRYFLLVPDKRYCFDALLAPSTVADVLDAHHASRRTHSLRSVIEHRALTTHSDCARHWRGDHGSLDGEGAGRVLTAIAEFETAKGGYVDVHAWYFTPPTLCSIVGMLREADFIPFEVERLYPTRANSIEFWAVLRMQPARASYPRSAC